MSPDRVPRPLVGDVPAEMLGLMRARADELDVPLPVLVRAITFAFLEKPRAEQLAILRGIFPDGTDEEIERQLAEVERRLAVEMNAPKN